MSQLRLNPLTGRWVTIATERTMRPDDFNRDRLAVETGPERPCPFCPGNEEETPPALETYGDEDRWQLRIVPNRYPAFSGSEPMTVRNLGPVFNQAPASGSHEVFVFSRDHATTWPDLDDEQAGLVMTSLRDRFEDHGRLRSVRYTQAIVNHGREAGASLIHPHGQLLGMPFVPGEIAEEEAGFRRFAGSCVLCTTAEAERDAASRVVLDGDGVLVVCPFWSGTPYEMLVVPDNHQGHLARSTPEVLHAVGRAIKGALTLLRDNVGDVSYNIVVHTLPHHHEDEFHWHVHVLPRVQSVGGFEQGTGVPINIVTPEQAAATLLGS
jgi:UDPglucose--hexose-1-phosphate uridylyltransferase